MATAATFSRVAYPEMRRFGYPQSFATGVIAAGGTLGIMIPPSTVLAVYGLITEQDVGKLFIAGILPGLLAIAMYMITITLIGVARPGFLPAGQRTHLGRAPRGAARRVGDAAAVRLRDRRPLRRPFTATEAAGAGAGGAFIIGSRAGGCRGADICARSWKPRAPPPRCSPC